VSNKQSASKRSGLGGNPLSQGLFSKTDAEETRSRAGEQKENPAGAGEGPQSNVTRIESRNKNLENRFLIDIEDGSKESIGLQVTAEINDWLDEVVKVGRRKHGKKIPKQVWIQAGVELLRAMPVEWDEVKDLDELRGKLEELSRAISEKK
jgi:hypothetical protein